MRVAVLGAFGLMAEAALHDLAANPKIEEVLAVDLNLWRAKAVLARIPQRRKIKALKADIRDTARCARLLRGSRALLNCAWFEHNLKAMDLALAARAHYVDLGGLFHMTLKQLKREAAFRRAGLKAVLGCGSTPGITNMMVSRMAPSFKTIDTVAIYDASHDPALSEEVFLPPFSIRTMLEEYCLPAPILLGGRMRAVPAHWEAEELDFKAPIGRCRAAAVIHSETATLPEHLKGSGVKNLYFKIAYPETVRRQLAFLVSMGLAKDEPLQVGAARISPRDFVTRLAQQQAGAPASAPADFEIMRVRVIGARHGRPLTKTWDCEIRPTRTLTAGAVGVGFAGAIAADMLARGLTAGSAAVAAPESLLDANVFFKELKRRGTFVFEETIAHPLPT
jgi:saccharopine dehydrogenase-like NADP-dependent oxidoreductase